MASRNAFKGGFGARLRKLSKEINALLRKQQDFLGFVQCFFIANLPPQDPEVIKSSVSA